MAAILLVDDNPVVQKLIGGVLTKRGHVVTVASGGHQALAAIARLHATPELVVTDVVMPDMDGWTLVRTLRARRDTALVPVLYLTALDSAEDRMRGFQLGADDFISKDCAVQEIQLRVERVLQRSQHARSDAYSSLQHRSGLMGDLAQLGLASLLMLLEMERKTGELLLKNGDVEASLRLRGGKVVDAVLKGVALDPDECVYRALAWSTGQFFMTGKPVEGPDRIGMSTPQLLMEGARRIDETGR